MQASQERERPHSICRRFHYGDQPVDSLYCSTLLQGYVVSCRNTNRLCRSPKPHNQSSQVFSTTIPSEVFRQFVESMLASIAH